MNFKEKYNYTTQLHKSYVCIGLDPHLPKIPQHLQHKDNPLWDFNEAIINKTKEKAAAYKLNYAFYIAGGEKGLEALRKSITAIPSHIPVILDVKAGDIANTMAHYGKAYFEQLQVDAVTVNPLMGEDVITPLLEYQDKFFFVLVITSNRSAADFLKKNSLYKEIAAKVNQWGTQQFGAVVGATNPEEMQEVRSLMPGTLFLVPGIGAQGGSLADVMHNAVVSKDEPGILINSSRGIIHAGQDEDFAEKAAEETEKLRTAINGFLS